MEGIVQAFVKTGEIGLRAGIAVVLVLLCRQIFFKRQPKQFCCLLWMVVFFRFLCPVTPDIALPVPQAWVESTSIWKSEWENGLRTMGLTRDGQAKTAADDLGLLVQAGGAEAVISSAGQPGAEGKNEAVDGQTDTAQESITAAGQTKAAGGVSDGGQGNGSADGLQESENREAWDKQGAFGSDNGSVRNNMRPAGYGWLLQAASVLWLFGAAAFLAAAVIRYGKLKRKLSTAVKGEAGGQIVWETDRIDSPFVLGFLKPAIYLPTGLSEGERFHIAAHERAHIDRRDYLCKALCYLGVIVHWMNPLAWIAFCFYNQDMEMACDERALQGFDRRERLDYSRTLLLTAAKGSGFSLPVFFGESDAKRRVQNILTKKKRTVLGGCLTAFLVCLLTALIFTEREAGQEKFTEGMTAEATTEEVTTEEATAEAADDFPARDENGGPEAYPTAEDGRPAVAAGKENSDMDAAKAERELCQSALASVEEKLRPIEADIAAAENSLAEIGRAMELAEGEEKDSYIEKNNETVELLNRLQQKRRELQEDLARIRQEVQNYDIMIACGYDLVEEKKKELETLPFNLQAENAPAYGIEMPDMAGDDSGVRAALRSFWEETAGNGSLPKAPSAIALEDGPEASESGDDPATLQRRVKSMTILIGGTTDEGALLITSVTAWGGGYIVMTDQSRDTWKGKDAEDIIIQYYDYLNWLTSENGQWEEVVASDRRNLTFEELSESMLSSRADVYIDHAYIGYFYNQN